VSGDFEYCLHAFLLRIFHHRHDMRIIACLTQESSKFMTLGVQGLQEGLAHSY
jgi:hypothetical protein